jgi:hypothetical protein
MYDYFLIYGIRAIIYFQVFKPFSYEKEKAKFKTAKIDF